MTEVFANFAQSTLSAPISASQTTITIATPAAGHTFPATGNFRIVVQSFDPTTLLPVSGYELMLVTAVSGNTFTVTRGAESTTAMAFASGATVAHVVTAAVMTALESGAGGVTSLNSLTGGLSLTSTGATVVITPSGSSINLETSAGGGNVNTTGTPASGNLTKFSGSTTITNGDLSGDVTTSGTLVTTVAKVNGVTYGASPSTNTVPVVTGVNTITYEAVPNAALANSSITIAGHSVSLGGSQTLSASDVGLGSVTNDAQTKAAIVPNTAPSSGQILAGNAGGTAYAPVAVSGDGTLASTGAITVTKTNGTSFSALATTIPGTGVATFLATPTSANLAAALTDETGSGAAVFATSPTLVTPILGTPTSGNLANCTLPANAQKRSISVTFDGGGTALTSGKTVYLATVPYAGTITAWDIVADQSGSAVIDVWKANAAVPTVANTITASAKPTISSAQSAFAGAITGWTTSVSAGDVFGFHLDSATTVTSVTLTILITAT